MTTISPNRKRAATRLQAFSLVVLVLAIVGVAALARTPLASLLWRIGSPLAQLRETSSTTLSIFFSGFGANHSLAVENALLRAQLASTSVLLEDRALLYSENIDLKSRLGRISPAMSSVLASVILRPPATPYDTLMIDVGRNVGVQVGDRVAAGGSVYIGTVREVYATTAEVVLFSAAGESYNALLLNATATTSVAISVAGQGGGSLTAEVPAGTPVAFGDSVVFSSIMPQLVARVIYIDTKMPASFKTIYMQLPVSISSLKFVEVRRAVPVVK